MNAQQIGAHLGALAVAVGVLAVPPILRWVWKAAKRKVGFGVLVLAAELALYLLWPTASLLPAGTLVTFLPQTASAVLLEPAPSDWGSPVPGSSGSISPQGTLQVNGLLANTVYDLCINGKPGQPPNDILRQPGYSDSTAKGEGYWDFAKLKTDNTGSIPNIKLEVKVPTGGWRLLETYDTKFFVKNDTTFRAVLFNDNFVFTVSRTEAAK